MDEMNDFEHLVAEETLAEAGPTRPTDVAAVVRTVATKSIQWRFRSMFSATKLLAATALIALVASIFLVQPLRPSTEDPAPGANAEPAAPVQFEARWFYGGDVSLPDRGPTEMGGDWVGAVNLAWAPGITQPGDPRLDGRLLLVGSSSHHSGLEIWNGAFRIENEDGAWQQRPMIQSVRLPGTYEPMTWTAVFDGEEAYQGLAIVAGITRGRGGWDVEGIIVDASVLPTTPTTLAID